MRTSRKVATIFGLLSIAGIALITLPKTGTAMLRIGPGGRSEEPPPAYHSEVPAGALPQTMDPASFDNPVVQNAYAVAAKVKKVLYQQPCYCHCDRSIGHQSLLDCYVGKHASVCDVCMREAFYAYEQTQKKKTPAQIRAGIEHGEWQQVDTSKYQTPPSKQ